MRLVLCSLKGLVVVAFLCIGERSMAEVAKPFNEDELLTDKISKKDIVTFLQANAASQVSTLCACYIHCFENRNICAILSL